MRSVLNLFGAALMASFIYGCAPSAPAVVIPEPGGYIRLVNAASADAQFAYSDLPPVSVASGEASTFQIASTKPKKVTVTIDGTSIEVTDQAPKSRQNLSLCLVQRNGKYEIVPVTGEPRDPADGGTDVYVYNLTQNDVTLRIGDKSVDAKPDSLSKMGNFAVRKSEIEMDGQKSDFNPADKQTYTVYLMPGETKTRMAVFPNKEIIEVTGIGGGMTP